MRVPHNFKTAETFWQQRKRASRVLRSVFALMHFLEISDEEEIAFIEKLGTLLL